MTEPKKWANQFGSGDMNDKRTSVWGKKLLGGTAGLGLTADQIVDLWTRLMREDKSKYNVYCEPFAGKARTYEALKEHELFENFFCERLEVYLNDLSPKSQKFCMENFVEATITGVSYEKTIRAVDSENTFFMIDPPWRKKIYTNNDFFITKSKWNTMIVKSNKKKKIFGKPARTMLCSNLIPDSMNKTEIDY